MRINSFSIDNIPISEAQLKQIQSAIDLLNSFEDLPQFEGLEDSFNKIGLMAINIKNKRCISFEHNKYLTGREHITQLFNAIQYETVLKINYKCFGKDVCDYYFHPQFFKQYNDRWYVLGISETAPSQIWNLALDRIQSIENTSKKYIKSDVDWDEYFDDVIGITNNVKDQVESIHFIVHGKTANYIYTKPSHGSQHALWLNENDLDIRLKVKINYELKRTLLSYVSEITLLSPQSLVDEHRAILEKALEQYKHVWTKFIKPAYKNSFAARLCRAAKQSILYQKFLTSFPAFRRPWAASAEPDSLLCGWR